MPNISETLIKATEILRQKEIAEPCREANSLLAFALQKNKTFLIAHPEYELSAEENKCFQDFLARRATREPLQYIRGDVEFYGLSFTVTPDVLIPRPETELIAENAIEILHKIENPRFCEVGVGSGCISVSILHKVKNASAVGLDISENALKIAEINAAEHSVSDRLNLKLSDVFSVLQNEEFDLIVSNPPYISSADFENLQLEVRDFEPVDALTDGADGLSIIKKIVSESPKVLRSGGYLLMEIGFNQSQKVSRMFDKNIWQSLEFLPDLQGIPRVVKAGKKGR